MVILVVSQHEAPGNWEIVSYKMSPTRPIISTTETRNSFAQITNLGWKKQAIFSEIINRSHNCPSFTNSLVRSFQFWLLTNRYWNWKPPIVSWSFGSGFMIGFNASMADCWFHASPANDLPIMKLLCLKKKVKVAERECVNHHIWPYSIPGGPWVCVFLATTQTDSGFPVWRCFDQ